MGNTILTMGERYSIYYIVLCIMAFLRLKQSFYWKCNDFNTVVVILSLVVTNSCFAKKCQLTHVEMKLNSFLILSERIRVGTS